MKKWTLKILATMMLSLLIYTVHAQDQTVCQETTKEYAVDLGDGANGTPGSTYVWTITATAPAVFGGTQNNITASGNHIEVDWGTSTLGNYTLSVIETTATGCETDPPITYTIEIVAGPSAPTVTAPSPICAGDDAVFTITGSPGNVVTYHINTDPDQTVTIDGDGSVDVVVGNVTANQTITITSVATDASANACTSTVSVTATITVNASPVTSPITPL